MSPAMKSVEYVAIIGCCTALGLSACTTDVRNDSRGGRVEQLLLAFSDSAQGADGGASPMDGAAELRMQKRIETCARDPRVVLGLVSQATCIGADLFFRETFDGNGRTCGSCHPVAHNFTLDADFIATLSPNDPLFVSDHDPALAELEIPALLRQFALIRVNADGFEDPTDKFVMRSVPHTLSLATSITPPPSNDGKIAIDHTTLPPNQRTGWSGDGAPGNGELRDFSDGAITQHATKSLGRIAGSDFRLPTDEERDALTEFMMNLGRKNELDLTQITFTDARAERGRQSFIGGAGRECNDCHHNAGANTVVTDDTTNQTFLGNFSFDVGTERARLAALTDFAVPFDGGFGLRPFDSDGDGVKDAFGTRAFNVPPLIEAADTGPFFHTNGAQTIEDAIRFYTTDAFGKSLSSAPSPSRPNGGAFVLSDDDIADLGGFLRAINAVFNCQLALARVKAALEIDRAFGDREVRVQRGMLELARNEVVDAANDLEGGELNPAVQLHLSIARRALAESASTNSRLRLVRDIAAARAFAHLSAANEGLGTGIHFDIGDGTLMF